MARYRCSSRCVQSSTTIYNYLRISLHDGGWSKEWIADMSMDCDYDLTVSCVQLDLVDSPGADTEDQETRSGAG